jgi:hypothetical protein
LEPIDFLPFGITIKSIQEIEEDWDEFGICKYIKHNGCEIAKS